MSTLVDEFTNLLSNTEYRIVVEYEYDLNDGLGKKVISKETSVVTKALCSNSRNHFIKNFR